MRQENIDFLNSNRDCLQEIINAQTATKANKIQGRLVEIMREEFLPGYVYSGDCGSCLFDMVKTLYQYFDSRPIVVKASFPENKKKQTK